jgi:hypothetical protein
MKFLELIRAFDDREVELRGEFPLPLKSIGEAGAFCSLTSGGLTPSSRHAVSFVTQ